MLIGAGAYVIAGALHDFSFKLGWRCANGTSQAYRRHAEDEKQKQQARYHLLWHFTENLFSNARMIEQAHQRRAEDE